MANLASVIMEGTSFGASSVDTNAYDYSNAVITETSYLNSAVATLFTDIMEAEQQYMVADVVGAATVIRESSLGNDIDTAAVIEGVISSGIAKLKAAWTKFLAKIKEFFKRVINWFKAMFANAKDFEKNYGKLIREKARKAKGFKYNGFKYTEEKGKSEVKAICDKVDTEIYNGTMKGFAAAALASPTKADFKAFLVQAQILKSDFKDEDSNVTEVIDDFIEKLGYSDSSEMTEEIYKAFRDGDDAKKEITDFEENSVEEMLKMLKDGQKKIDDLGKTQKKYEDSVNKIVKKLDAVEKDKDATGDAETAQSNIVSNASYLSSLLTGYLNVYKSATNEQINAWKAMMTDYLSILKKFYNYKGNKDYVAQMNSYVPFEYSAMESADPEDDDDDSKDVEEGFGGKKSSCESYTPSTESAIDSILEQASRFSL